MKIHQNINLYLTINQMKKAFCQLKLFNPIYSAAYQAWLDQEIQTNNKSYIF